MMICWMSLVTIMAGYFFYRVLTGKPKNNSDDKSENL